MFETTDRYTNGLVFTMQMQEIVEILSATKTPKKDGKGNPYTDVIELTCHCWRQCRQYQEKSLGERFAKRIRMNVRRTYLVYKNRLNIIEKTQREVANNYLTQTSSKIGLKMDEQCSNI